MCIVVFSPRSNKSGCRSLHCVTGGLLPPSQQVLILNVVIGSLESIIVYFSTAQYKEDYLEKYGCAPNGDFVKAAEEDCAPGPDCDILGEGCCVGEKPEYTEEEQILGEKILQRESGELLFEDYPGEYEYEDYSGEFELR